MDIGYCLQKFALQAMEIYTLEIIFTGVPIDW